jgi:hypothetical protein
VKNGSLLAVLGLALVLGLSFILPPASAQSAETVRVALPFQAIVGTVTLPAGEYIIRELDNAAENPVLEITSVNGHVSAMVLAASVPTANTLPSPKSEVVLRHEGSKYIATAIWLAGRDYGFELPVPAARE